MSGCTPLQVIDTASARRRLGGRLIAGFLALTVFAGTSDASSASDLAMPAPPAFQPPPPPPAEFSWTGFYIGAHVGFGIDHFAFSFGSALPGAAGSVAGPSGITAVGPIGGVQAGFNYELPFFHIVAGIEVDNSLSGISGETTINGVLTSGAPFSQMFGSRYRDFGTVRLRLGYAWGRLLPYLAGGFTYGTRESFYSFSSLGFFSSGTVTETRSGVPPHVATIGVGVEYAIAPNVTIKAEYLYDFLNARAVTFFPAPGAVISFGTRTAYHIGRVGFNYKFDLFSPLAPSVLAKY